MTDPVTLPPGYTLRPATPADAELIQAQRDAIFTDMGRDPEMIAAVSPASLAWLQDALGHGTYQGVLVQDASTGETVAGAGVTWQRPQPSPFSQLEGKAYLDNVYVAPQARRQGLARALMQQLMDECARRGVRLVTLHASDAGRPLYEGLGFAPTAEMSILLPGASLLPDTAQEEV